MLSVIKTTTRRRSTHEGSEEGKKLIRFAEGDTLVEHGCPAKEYRSRETGHQLKSVELSEFRMIS